MNRTLQVKKTTDVATELLTKEEFKTWARIDTADDDTLIESLITQVRDSIERKTGLAIGEQEIEVIADLCGTEYELPRGPNQTSVVVEIKQSETDWDMLTVNTEYDLEETDFVKIQSYPAGRLRITYTTGYDTDLPASLKLLWMKLTLAHYEIRGDTGTENIKQLENELNQYKRFTNLL